METCIFVCDLIKRKRVCVMGGGGAWGGIEIRKREQNIEKMRSCIAYLGRDKERATAHL